MKSYSSIDGTVWRVAVEMPSHSNAMIVFVHPAATALLNRYAWLNAHGAQVNDPRARLKPAAVLEGIADQDLARLFRRSMPIHASRPAYSVS